LNKADTRIYAAAAPPSPEDQPILSVEFFDIDAAMGNSQGPANYQSVYPMRNKS
jgi:succinylarginine dihydrolase